MSGAHESEGPVRAAARSDRGHHHAPAQSSWRPADGLRLAGVSFEDWDCLLEAVTMRLRIVVSETPVHVPNGAGVSLQASVLECADALEQLHMGLRTALSEAQSIAVSAAATDRTAPERP
jgi:hypothetical protein